MRSDRGNNRDSESGDQGGKAQLASAEATADGSTPAGAGRGPDGRSDNARSDDSRSEWLRQLDEECPYQVVLPRGPGDGEIMNFLNAYVGKFDMYAEDEYAVFVRYCFADPLDAAIFRSRFEFKAGRLKLAG
jgi:hypothetical protein